ncbi:hypothetical protein AUJ14_01385 [Candidatus Micrarchaeota archaeon CG1_02_55_22]|nr:MAG: hypothetical protein AUJ14_01385 [Candidatus Micrarchaeota archaeon CG1_02_55_22]
MTERCLIDTNLLVYAFDESDAKHAAAETLLKDLVNSGRGVVSVQNLAEFSRVMTEKIPSRLSGSQARSLVLRLSDNLVVVEYDARTVADALAMHERYGVHFFDALLVATMEQHGVTKIVTENAGDFKGIEWLEAKNPFE